MPPSVAQGFSNNLTDFHPNLAYKVLFSSIFHMIIAYKALFVGIFNFHHHTLIPTQSHLNPPPTHPNVGCFPLLLVDFLHISTNMMDFIKVVFRLNATQTHLRHSIV